MNETTSLQRIESPTEMLAFSKQMGEYIAKCGMFGVTKPEQGPIIAYTCRVRGMDLIQFNETYDIIDGKLRRKANNALAEFRKRGGKHKWLNFGGDGKAAELELTDWDGNKLTVKFTIEDARKGGASFKEGSAWTKTPDHMLRARCISKGVMALAPEIYCGGDEYSEADTPPAQPLNLASQPAPTVTVTASPATEKVLTPQFKPSPAPEPAPVIQDAEEVTPAPEPTKAEAQPEPQPDAKPADPVPEKTTPEMEAKIIEICGDQMDAAYRWLVSKDWIKEGETLAALALHRATTIISRPDMFLESVKKGVAK